MRRQKDEVINEDIIVLIIRGLSCFLFIQELEKYRRECERKTKLREQQQQYQKMTTNKEQNNRTIK